MTRERLMQILKPQPDIDSITLTSKLMGLFIKAIPVILLLGAQFYAIVHWVEGVKSKHTLDQQALTLRIDSMEKVYAHELDKVRQEYASALAKLTIVHDGEETAAATARASILAAICTIRDDYTDADKDIIRSFNTMHIKVQNLPVIQNMINNLNQDTLTLKEEVSQLKTDVAILRSTSVYKFPLFDNKKD